MTRKLATFVLLLLSGCASTPPTVTGPATPPSAGRYEAEAGRDAATIAEMRAAPAPAMPEIVAGRNPTADHDRLIRQGYVRIGTSHYALAETAAREAALRQGRAVGAERVSMYAPAAGTTPPTPGEWLAVYYVRFQLPFGATFRDLHASERQALGATGGVAIGSVVSGTPASRANLIAGDVVLKFDDQPIAGRSAFQSLLKSRAGHPVTLTIVRNGETLQRRVRLGAMATAN